jgi:hypothetical protein
LSHRYIVRYYTTWTEIAALSSRENSDSDDSDNDTIDGTATVSNSKRCSPRGWSNISESLRSNDLSGFSSNPTNNRSFPNVLFGYADSTSTEGSNDGEPAFGDGSNRWADSKAPKGPTGKFAQQQVTLYIQMVCFFSA